MPRLTHCGLRVKVNGGGDFLHHMTTDGTQSCQWDNVKELSSLRIKLDIRNLEPVLRSIISLENRRVSILSVASAYWFGTNPSTCTGFVNHVLGLGLDAVEVDDFVWRILETKIALSAVVACPLGSMMTEVSAFAVKQWMEKPKQVEVIAYKVAGWLGRLR